MNIYVGNLAYSTTNDDLKEAFENFGMVKSAIVINDKETGRSKGFGFVEMETKADGEKALTGLNGKELNGRTLRVNEAQPRPARTGGRDNNRGGDRNNNRRDSFSRF
jgi:RNA recognition motif-containing protein